MSESNSFLSQTLQSITTTKKREQHKRRTTYESRKAKLLRAVDASGDPRERLSTLLEGFAEIPFSNRAVHYVDEDQKRMLGNMSRYLEQSKCDPSIPDGTLLRFEKKMRERLDQESARFEFANLYYRLLAEWTTPNNNPMTQQEPVDIDMDGSFEHVAKYNLQKLQDKFSSIVFTPMETDEIEIDMYLASLFEDEDATKLLETVRKNVADFGASLKKRINPFNEQVIKDCIKALLTNDLLNDDVKSTLSDFTTNTVALNEIADVLNLRFQDLDSWSWEAEDGIYYEPRPQTNGKYRIMMDQEMLQSIFLHYIAVSWCMHLKSMFKRIIDDYRFWHTYQRASAEAEGRREYFTGNTRSSYQGMEYARWNSFRDNFFLSAMADSLVHAADPYDEEQGQQKKSSHNLRQQLLQQIASSAIVRRSLKGDFVVVQSDLQWYASALPHSTLFAVLRFWGVPQDWLEFFKEYCEAPLRMDSTPGENVRVRKRGIPITDAFEKLFGETVLFCMDVAVNRIAKTNLTRFHDDLWLFGEPSTCAHAWETIQDFVKVLGLDINTRKTGSVYISRYERDAEIVNKLPKGPVCMGMLQLSDTGDWTLDQTQVSAHVRQLQKQLGECSSIIGWIQIWNACMERFFQNAFGKPANCFGQAHVDAILETYANMQRKLFPEHAGSVAQYLREQLFRRFEVSDIPDAFLFLPEELGGLGLKNPFVPFLGLKENLIKDPLQRMDQFLDQEKQNFKAVQESFAAATEDTKETRFKTHLRHIVSTRPDDTGFTFEEYVSDREVYSAALENVYGLLMTEPGTKEINLENEIEPWFKELAATHNLGWFQLDNETGWMVNLYGDELKQRFGALSIVDKNMLPSGVMKMMKKKKVRWQMIIWD